MVTDGSETTLPKQTSPESVPAALVKFTTPFAKLQPLTVDEWFCTVLVGVFGHGVAGILTWLAWGHCCAILIAWESVRASTELQGVLARNVHGRGPQPKLRIS